MWAGPGQIGAMMLSCATVQEPGTLREGSTCKGIQEKRAYFLETVCYDGNNFDIHLMK